MILCFQPTQLNVNYICQKCKELIVNFHKFKQQVQINVCKKMNPILKQIIKFVGETEEEVSVMLHHDCLSLVIDSKKMLMENFVHFNPAVLIQQDKDASVSKKRSSIRFSDVPPTVERYEQIDGPPDENDKYGRGFHSIFFGRNCKINQADSYSSDDELNDPSFTGAKVPLTAAGSSSRPRRGRKRKLPEPEVKVEVVGSSSSSKPEAPAVAPKKRRRRKNAELSKVPVIVTKATVNPSPPSPPQEDKTTTNDMTTDEQEWLRNQIDASRVDAKSYKCSECQKLLSSHSAIRYHLMKRHLTPRNQSKEWISSKIKDGMHVILSEDGTTTIIQWKCSECPRFYNNSPALRYHLKVHLRNDCNDDGSNDAGALSNEEETVN